MKFINIGVLLVAAILLTACDPIHSIKHSVSFKGSISHECIVNAAKDIDGNVMIKKIEDQYGHRDFDEYIISNSKTWFEFLWFRNDRNKIQMGIMGIGYADKKRDFPTCELIRVFQDSLINFCNLDRKTITVNDENIRVSCD
jgi:hypothetical protein